VKENKQNSLEEREREREIEGERNPDNSHKANKKDKTDGERERRNVRWKDNER